MKRLNVFGILLCCLLLAVNSCTMSQNNAFEATVTFLPTQLISRYATADTPIPALEATPIASVVNEVHLSPTPSSVPTMIPDTPMKLTPTRMMAPYSLPDMADLEVINLENASRLTILAEIELTEGNSPPFFDVSPDGKTVAVVNVQELWRVEILTGDLLNQFSTPEKWRLGYVTYSPDGKQIAVVHGDGEIVLLDAEAYETLQVLRDTENFLPSDVSTVAFSPDGKFLVSCGWAAGSETRIWDLERGVVVQKLDSNQFQAAFSPDGKLMVTTGRDGWTTVWDVSTWTVHTKIANSVGGSAYMASFTPDGRLLAIEGQMNIDEETGIAVYDAGSWEQVSYQGPIDSNFAFNVDGDLIAFGEKNPSGELVLKNTVSDDVVFSSKGLGIVHVKFTQDGRLLVTRDGEKGLQIWGVLK